jgi:PBP1b-binding outer membrane lipoprotein LpoB
MADVVSKLKTAALIAGAALFVVACGEKKAEAPAADTATTTEAPAADAMAPAADAAPADAMATAPAAGAADAMAPAADAAAAPAADAAAAPAEAK